MDRADIPKKRCPYCNSEAKLDFAIWGRPYFRCGSCDLMYRGDLQVELKRDLFRHFEREYFSEYAHDQLSGSRNQIYTHILDVIEKETAVGRILDVGCGCGFFLKEAKDRGWNMEGVEPSKESVDYATILLGGNFVHAGTLQDFPALGEFDVVTLIDALGFSSTPWSDIERIRTLLKPGGLLFIRCSNSFLHAFLFKISIRLMMDSFVSELVVFHKYPLTPRFILRLLRDYGFSNVNIRNAKPSGGGLPLRFLKSAISIIANSLYYLSRRRIIIGPSLEVMERKP